MIKVEIKLVCMFCVLGFIGIIGWVVVFEFELIVREIELCLGLLFVFYRGVFYFFCIIVYLLLFFLFFGGWGF